MDDQSLSIAPEPFDSDDARRLIAGLNAGLAELYLPEQRFGERFRAHHLEGGGTFLVARSGGTAVGCGALRVVDATTAEVKRMYVDPGYRGKGIGRALLASLEAAARERAVQRLVLETGVHQETAIALYQSVGFRQVNCWGEYASSATSLCFECSL